MIYNNQMQKNLKVILFGERSQSSELGRFAHEIKQALDAAPGFQVALPGGGKEEGADVALYVTRTDKQLKQAVSVCEEQVIPLFVLSTDVTKPLQALTPKCEVRFVPNSSIEVLDYMAKVSDFWSGHKNLPVRITEYHQASKAGISGTAVEIAKQIDFPEQEITSVRNDAIAKEKFDIPDDKLGGYAIHQIVFTNPSTNVPTMFEIKVYGRSTYVQGLLEILTDYARR